MKVEGKNGGDLKVLVLRLRRHLEKSPKRGYTEKDNDSGCCPVKRRLCFLTFFLFDLFFPIKFQRISRNEKCVRT